MVFLFWLNNALWGLILVLVLVLILIPILILILILILIIHVASNRRNSCPMSHWPWWTRAAPASRSCVLMGHGRGSQVREESPAA